MGCVRYLKMMTAFEIFVNLMVGLFLLVHLL